MSDADTRNALRDTYPDNKNLHEVTRLINELASSDQRMKLYIKPYLQMTDPDTSKMYPTISSRLATRRLSSSNPNFMQLAKDGYVRGFFVPDNKDHVFVSMDWSQIELVLIAMRSQDPEFLACYSKLPYQDLHLKALASVALNVSDEEAASIKTMPDNVESAVIGGKVIPFVDNMGQKLTPRKFFSFIRKKVGKVANFEYWYSGALAGTAETMRWSGEQMWDAVDRYRNKFRLAETWRTGVQDDLANKGYVENCNGLRRERLEATSLWNVTMLDKFKSIDNPNYDQFEEASTGMWENFGRLVCNRIRKRALNQGVNALIQGDCAVLAKRTILKMREAVKHLDVRFVMSIHDELLYSCHRDQVLEFIDIFRRCMKDHADIMGSTPLDCTAAIGLNFRAYDASKNPIGQVELDEMPPLPCITEERYEQRATATEIQDIINYLFKQREDLNGQADTKSDKKNL
jgi:DNA polymerase I-like protein with 3'-5' exonuclease and polymerase domains